MVWCFSGLTLSYVIWGYLQELILTTSYGESIQFHYTEFLIFSNRIFAVVLGFLLVYFRRESPKSLDSPDAAAGFSLFGNAPPITCLIASVSNITSTWLQYEALRFVSFPLQVLAKSTKVLFVMLMGRLVHGRRHHLSQYFVALFLAVGITLYRLSETVLLKFFSSSATNDSHPVDSSDNTGFFIGVFLLAGYVLTDSFTSNWQSRCFRDYKISANAMMISVNVCSAILSFALLLLYSQLGPVLRFLLTYPSCWLHIAVMSFCSAIGQLFIYHTISRYGPITFSCVMTARQLISIVLSIVAFGHPMNVGGALGLALVFGALSFKIYQDSRRSIHVPKLVSPKSNCVV